MTIALDIDTTKSLYRPVEIRIDGKTFRVKVITQGALEEIQRLGNEGRKGSAVAIRQMLESVLDGPTESLLKLTLDQIGQVVEVAIGKAISPDAKEKNAHRPRLKK